MHMEFTELGPIKILIVDDQETNVMLMETLLQAEGYATVSASNGREALTLANSEKPDLILLDIMMPDQVDFHKEVASQATIDIANWIVKSGDHEKKPFIIIDKLNAKVFVFDHFGYFHAAAPALLGLTEGDDLSPGMGARALSTILPAERTTPAGRFLSSFDYNLKGELVLWIDYDSGIALHRVSLGVPSEKRLQRLASPTATDNRITYGCINVSEWFFKNVVMPEFSGVYGLVYILPEMPSHTLEQVFGQGLTKDLK